MIPAAEFLDALQRGQGKPGHVAKVERVIPTLLPPLISAAVIALVIIRPLLLFSSLCLIATNSVSLFWLGFSTGVLWLCVMALHAFWSRASASPGFHSASPKTEFHSRVAQRLGRFLDYQAPVWNGCGYFCTVFPFFFYHPKRPEYFRYWLQADDGQSLYVDWSLPQSGNVKSICLCLHGVNGDSDANYVKDFATRMAERGFAVGCMVNRGMGDSIVKGPPSAWFSCARTCDIRCVVDDTLRLLGGMKPLPIYLAGFSNGGTMLTNYVGKMGETLRGKINGCFCISSTLRADRAIARPTVHIWQYPVCFLLMKKFVPRICAGAGMAVPKEWLKISTVTGLDERLILPYQGYKNLGDYYKALSAGSSGAWRGISIPTLMLHAKDDPVLHVDDTAVPELYNGNSNLMLLVTGTGGHVGWPSSRSLTERWQYVADLACEFFCAVEENNTSR